MSSATPVTAWRKRTIPGDAKWPARVAVFGVDDWDEEVVGYVMGWYSTQERAEEDVRKWPATNWVAR